jgi:competence CoiA-like predicted nuclease
MSDCDEEQATRDTDDWQKNNSQNGFCKVCKEELNMYGGCRCNGYTTAFEDIVIQ